MALEGKTVADNSVKTGVDSLLELLKKKGKSGPKK